ncbi:unnamed protein product [Lepeophtheirus salmonis]|uniref:(salmon louse) hypothetical protein n=1 Tax=Lepeophtheirus salmonis TaxID=72036 RepID=A0A7R8H218_LEPSM|nr:unnamed protein product [Lepeophtheirus salmonis]CAF2821736.1 unnamed protein product [Lepeophtheirus salmonis]
MEKVKREQSERHTPTFKYRVKLQRQISLGSESIMTEATNTNGFSSTASKKEHETPSSTLPLLFLAIRSKGLVVVPSPSESNIFMRNLMERNFEALEKSQEDQVIHISWWNYIDTPLERFAIACQDNSSYLQLSKWVKDMQSTPLTTTTTWKVILPSILSPKFTPSAIIDEIIEHHELRGEITLQKESFSSLPEAINDPRSDWTLHLNLDLEAELSLNSFQTKMKDGRSRTIVSIAGFSTYWWKMSSKSA